MTKQQKEQSSSGAPEVTLEMRTYLSTQIEADERVLWVGTTNISERMRRLRPIIIMCICMMLFCSVSVLLMDNPSWLFLLIMCILVWAGIPTFIVRRQSNHLRNTIYALTDQRALILSLDKPKRTESYPPAKIEFVRPVVKQEGYGDLYFTVLRGKGQQRHQRINHGFLAIAEVEYVASLMRQTFPQKS
jgi:purine-cytosine permease-like protein